MTNFITFLLISILLVLAILLATYFINFPSNDYEKHSAYESGFEPFGDARSFFDIQFYTIGLLFIIFDLEVVFLIPLVIDIANISLYGYICFITFLFIVLLGFYYEWAIGLLNWLPAKVKFTKPNMLIGIFIPMDLLSYIDPIFISLLVLIVFSLSLNYLNNLIYRVINLASLSLITVGMWVYFTDFIFLYVVYILAFVGAVIMLFLSVILMLPSSVTLTTKNKITNIAFFLITTEVFIERHNFYYLILFVIFIIIFYSTYIVLYIIDLSIVDIIVFLKWFYSKLVSINVRELSVDKIWQNCKWVFNYIFSLREVFGLSIPASTYSAYIKDPIDFSKIPKLAIIGIFIHDCLNFLYINIESKLYYKPISKEMYQFTQPVWGDLFKVLEYKYSPARSLRNTNWPIKDLYSQYNPIQLRLSLFKLFPEPVQVILISYFYGNTPIITILNRFIFIFNCLIFFSVNTIIAIFNKVIEVNVNLLVYLQAIISGSIFFNAVPYTFTTITTLNYKSLLPNTDEYLTTDSLLAIKSILYESNFSYLLMSVIGLLVALIGSAVFTRSSHNK